MRVTAILLCLFATAASAQQSRAPSEESLTPPPITTAPPDNEPPAHKPAVITPAEDDFLPPPNTSAPPVQPPPPLAAPTPPSEPPAVRTTPPPPSQPALRQPPRSTGPAEPARERAMRYSRYSAGSGGAMLALTEAMAGVVTGAMLGSAFDVASDVRDSDAYTGALVGGLSLGTAAVLYQYFIPVGRREGVLAAGAATAGMMASLTIANSRSLSDKDRAMLSFASTQAGILGVLLLTAGGDDVSAGDAGLVGAGSLYGFVLTGLVEYIHAKQSDQHYNFVPLLLSPAIGMALGGLLAIPVELPSSSVFEMTTYPLGAGALALLIGSRLADDVIVAKTVLGTIAGTFLLVGMVNLLSGAPGETPQKYSSTVQLTPIPVVMPAGRGNDSLAAGPGLFLRF